MPGCESPPAPRELLCTGSTGGGRRRRVLGGFFPHTRFPWCSQSSPSPIWLHGVLRHPAKVTWGAWTGMPDVVLWSSKVLSYPCPPGWSGGRDPPSPPKHGPVL